ncbi:PREDICTED: malonyl-CoA decarboxylase, mitochondrial-like [Nanorana parkeri]|uniref:malonyl-CoA decarboxylase, mitochondrial-like n=1 Tax=Nanorana parkeri TaxID=125878 RepID=UPI000854E0DD|nr:PREDICTED: malonyl-CoA decarboxylase, mitochondrial-like [Nanorana parkeri]
MRLAHLLLPHRLQRVAALSFALCGQGRLLSPPMPLHQAGVSFRQVSSMPTVTMKDILSKCVPPLPPYETKDKTPPPPEPQSLHFIQHYKSLDLGQRAALLGELAASYGVDHSQVVELSGKLVQDQQTRDLGTVLQVEDRLRYYLTPQYKVLFLHVSKLEGGMKFLVDLRADIIASMTSKLADGPHIRVSPPQNMYWLLWKV